MKDRILSTPHEMGVFNGIVCKDGDRLIVGYSEERARKNQHDRDEGIERLRKRYAKGTLTKASGCPYSVDNVLRIAEVIVTLEINLPESRQTVTRTLYTSKEERDIAYLIETDDWLTSNGWRIDKVRNIEVSFSWKNGRVTSWKLVSPEEKEITLNYNGRSRTILTVQQDLCR